MNAPSERWALVQSVQAPAGSGNDPQAPPGPPGLAERPVPTWQKVTAIIYVIVVTAAIVVFRDRLRSDFWPIDDARVSPNILATVIQILLYTPVAILLWPPFRRRIHRFITSHTAPLHDHLADLHAQHERHQAEQMAKLEAIHDHIRRTHPL